MGGGSFSEVSALATLWVNGTAWVWWGDGAGRLRRAALTQPAPPARAELLPALTLIPGGASIRGLAIDARTRRLYWSWVWTRARPAGWRGAWAAGARGGVSVATLHAARRATLHAHDQAEPDDIVIHPDTGQLFWSDRGSTPGIMTAAGDGSAARWVVRRRARRVSALALHAAGARLYFVDAYYDTLESVRLDGSARALVAAFALRVPRAPPVPHYERDELSAAAVSVRACARLVVWEEWAWCGGARGLARLPRRPRVSTSPAPAPVPRHDRTHVTGLALLMERPADEPANPCARADGGELCDPSALCVRGARGFACLCPDGLQPSSEGPEKKCVSSPFDRLLLEGGGGEGGARSNGSCSLACGLGKCVLDSEGVEACSCPPLYGGAQCQHFRCARHCAHRGRCYLDPAPQPPNATAPPPLKCDCFGGYSGPRCETAPTIEACSATRCHNGGTCHVVRGAPLCVCAPGYTGARCSQCLDAAACAGGAVCRRVAGVTRCEPAQCVDYCLNQGTCHVSGGGAGAAVCTCAAGWSGERCQRRACVDAACRAHAAPAGHAPSADHAPSPADHAPAGAPALDNRSTSHAASEPAVAGECAPGACAQGGRCVLARVDAGPTRGVCVCAAPYGGPRCAHYVGHDDACRALACRQPHVCAWKPSLNSLDEGTPFCACPSGASCIPAAVGAGAGTWGAGAWVAALALAALLALVAALWLARRRRGFPHARLPDNVEISNPMYLAGDDEPEPAPRPPQHTNGGNHFANPVYESMYAPQQNIPTEEHANLLAEARDASPPPERAALL
ncbi:low-density lipoprotein receptor-related protein 1B-like [Ostrinia furnacalis]|uniref:low-density lipoprotein receptor-related protein 1B-like n=1 Tax=Ostrinia furnacalis TaxID=93504 RepID=UPI00103F2BA4|nr:low-density lipoprotein receptor-related protein 1B-like [Ostrinia furnacalis]